MLVIEPVAEPSAIGVRDAVDQERNRGVVAEHREADVETRRDAADDGQVVPMDVIVDDVGGHPAIDDEALAEERKRARQHELAGQQRIGEEDVAADFLGAEVAGADADTEGGQRVGVLDVGGAADVR